MSLDWDKILEDQASDPGFAPVPASKYPVRVDQVEATKASTGNDMLNLQCVIEGGPYDGKKVFTRIVFAKDNPTAMRFTLRKLAALGVTKEVIAAQKPSLEKIAQLITGARAEADVVVRPATEEFDASNDVKSFKRLGEPSAAGSPVPAGAAAAPPAPPIPTPAAPPAPPIPTPEAPAPAPAAEAPTPPAPPVPSTDEEPF